MRDRILTILSSLRRRMLAVRAAEAAAVGGAAGGLSCAFIMAAWIVAARWPAAAAVLSAVPLSGGVLLLTCRPARAVLRLKAPLQWYVAILPAVLGAGGVSCILTGTSVYVPKNWLFMSVPAAAALAGLLVFLRGAGLASVAAGVDRRAALRERLSTAWELAQAREERTFARAVRDQALAAADGRGLRGLSFWTRTPATLGALGLAVMAAALMLPWEPLSSPQAAVQRRWRQVSGQAGRLLQQPLARLDVRAIVGSANVSAAVRRLQELAERLRAAEPADATDWRGQVVELRELAAALRQAVKAGRLDPTTTARIARLIQTVEQAAAEIAEGMGQPAEFAAGKLPAPTPSARAWETAPAGYATVYSPRYRDLPSPTTAETPPARPDSRRPPAAQVPYERAWAAARRRAAEALRNQDVPAEYRQLIRDFFATDR